jgi:hypothetical protein
VIPSGWIWLPNHTRPRNYDEIIAQALHLGLDVSVPGVLPDRRLHITCLTIIDAFNVVRLEYEIIPLNEPPSPESAEVSRAYCPWGWMVGGRDDGGTVYDDRGEPMGSRRTGLWPMENVICFPSIISMSDIPNDPYGRSHE